MSNRDNDTTNTAGGGTMGSGGAGTGATSAGTTRGGSSGEGLATSPFGAGGQSSGEGGITIPYGSGGQSSGEGSGTLPYGSGGAATGTATGLAAQAKEYGQKVADAATQAKDYIAERASNIGTTVGDKFKDLQNTDFRQVAEDAKEYARQKPGQALLISAAAGFVLGLLLRGSRR